MLYPGNRVGHSYLVGMGCRCVTSWCDLHLTFHHDIVTLRMKNLFLLYLRNCKVDTGFGGYLGVQVCNVMV